MCADATCFAASKEHVSAPENGTNTDNAEIVDRENAPGRDFGVVSNLQRAARDAIDESALADRAVAVRVEEVSGPGKARPNYSLLVFKATRGYSIINGASLAIKEKRQI